ncbi:MAG: hypothetical protein ACREQY_11465 [Candidatus Binatia bacterium]
MDCSEYREWIAADVDDAGGAGVEEARRHAEGCPDCRAARSEAAAVRSLLRSRSRVQEAPFGLRTRVLARIEEEASASRVPLWGRALRWAAIACLVLVALPLLNPSEHLDPTIESYHLALRGELPLSVRAESLAEIEEFYRRHAARGIRAHVVDLSAAGFRPVGGTLRDVRGAPLRLTVYSDGKSLIVCDYRAIDRYEGKLPKRGEPLVFSRGGLTFCVRRIGDEVCILATRLPTHVMVRRLLGRT